MEMNDLVLRQKTTAQTLPVDLNCKVTSFHSSVIQQEKIQLQNMDETPVNFYMTGNQTVKIKGAKLF
jgi:hypothetical protein